MNVSFFKEDNARKFLRDIMGIETFNSFIKEGKIEIKKLIKKGEKMDIMSFVKITYGNRKRNNVIMIIAITAMVTLINIYHIFKKK